MHASLARFWDHDRLPPPGLFDPRDEAQFNVLALHLLGLYWRHLQVEAFAAFCTLCRDELLRDAARAVAPERRAACSPEALVDTLLGELFASSGRHAPRLLHLRAFARSRFRALAEATSRPATAHLRERLAVYLAGVE